MKTGEAKTFIEAYFHELFENRDITALDRYLAKDYWDDDIGEEGIDHITNSKAFLQNLFQTRPKVKVRVGDVMIKDEVLAAYLEWYEREGEVEDVFRKGIALFEIKNMKIVKRHTYIYFDE